MDVKIDVTGARELSVHYNDAPALIAQTTFPLMRKITQRLLTYVAQNKLRGDPLNFRTRTLTRALFNRIEINGQDVVGRVGFDLAKAKYARAVTLGAVITPKRAQFLTIPVGQALTPAGVARIDAREFIERTSKNGSGWRGFTSSFVNKNKTAIMGVKKSGDVEPVFALKRRVTLPVRDVLGDTLSENVEEIRTAIATGVIAVVRKVKSA